MSKTVVIGASSGLGRCIGLGLAQRGDQVALLARRRDRIENAAKEAGPDAVGVECDVTDEASVRSAISTAADALGGIDNLVYSPAIGPLVRLVDTDAETWARVFATNVTGAAIATAAAIPHLTASGGKVVYISSDAGTFAPPWPGLGAYGVSKAALERLIEAWRAEHPDIGFTNLIVGRMHGRRRGLADGVQHRLGSRSRDGALPALDFARMHAWPADAGRGPRRCGAHDPADQLGDVDAGRGRTRRARPSRGLSAEVRA